MASEDYGRREGWNEDEKRFEGILRVFLKQGKNAPADGTAAVRNQPGSAAQHVPAIKKQAHDFKYQAADERNRGLAFLTRRLAMKRQVVDFLLRADDGRTQAAAIKKRGLAIKNPCPARKHPPADC